MGSITPPGGWIYGIQLPVQTLSRMLADPWEGAATVDDLVTVARRGRGRRPQLRRRVRPRGHTRQRLRRPHEHHLVRHGGDAGVPGRPHHHGQPGLGGVDRGLPPPSADGQGVRHARPPVGGAGPSWGWGLAMWRPSSRPWGWTSPAGAAASTRSSRRCEAPSNPTTPPTGASTSPMTAWGWRRRPGGSCRYGSGGRGRAAWRRAGRYGDGYIPMGNPKDQYPEIIETMASSAAAAGRDGAAFDVGYMPPWAYLLGRSAPEGLPPAGVFGPEPLAADLRAARSAGGQRLPPEVPGPDPGGVPRPDRRLRRGGGAAGGRALISGLRRASEQRPGGGRVERGRSG